MSAEETGKWKRSHLLARLFAVCGVLLVPWIGVLIAQLHGYAGKRSFDSSWVGLDVLEAVGLLTVAACSPADTGRRAQ